jgi:hypothetical protein
MMSEMFLYYKQRTMDMVFRTQIVALRLSPLVWERWH